VPSAREQYLQALVSLSDLTRTQAERVAALLAKQGEVQSAQVNRVTEDLMRRTQKNREIMSRLIQREVKRQLGVLGMATRDEVARLQQRVRALEQEVERASKAKATTASSGTTRSRASRTTATSAKSRTAKPSTRTRTAGASTRSTASSPATRRKKDTGSASGGSAGSGSGSDSGGSAGSASGSASGGSAGSGSGPDRSGSGSGSGGSGDGRA
jgi:dTMP kinase